MRIALFCHSLISDWNHGNAHFLRGVVSELALAGHDVRAFEPRDAWSVANLVSDHGTAPIADVLEAYPHLHPRRYDPASLDLDEAMDGADLVVVHEWNDPCLVRRIGAHRPRGRRSVLLFHDTHHRAVTDPAAMRAYDLSEYDGVLAFGRVLAEIYAACGLARRAIVWHEAADTRVFRPLCADKERDLVWIGNHGDGERKAELEQYLVQPVRDLGLSAQVHGVRYPEAARRALAEAGIANGGWLANHRVPDAFARARVTVHVPRRPYVEALPGIPTIRPFEALACGIPLVSAPWDDVEHLFTEGRDFLLARSPADMTRKLRDVLNDPALAASLAEHGLRTILARHTCAHRARELVRIARDLGASPADSPAAKREELTP